MREKFIGTIRKWLLDHETAFLTISGMIVIGLLCFVWGWYTGAQIIDHPITVVRSNQDPVVIEKASSQDEPALLPEDCVYVGSVKGTKYYPPSCSYATKIDPENLRCFRSDQDAQDKGYTKSTSCDNS